MISCFNDDKMVVHSLHSSHGEVDNQVAEERGVRIGRCNPVGREEPLDSCNLFLEFVEIVGSVVDELQVDHDEALDMERVHEEDIHCNRDLCIPVVVGLHT